MFNIMIILLLLNSLKPVVKSKGRVKKLKIKSGGTGKYSLVATKEVLEEA